MRNESLIRAAAAGMELTWRCAWINYLTLALLQLTIPWIGAATSFFAAGLLATALGRRRTRRVWMPVLHGIGLAASILVWLYHFHGGGHGLFQSAWLKGLLGSSHPPTFWIAVLFETGLAASFWIGGLTWSRRAIDYDATTQRFDLGLSAFVFLFLFRFALRARFGYTVPEPAGPTLLVSFFSFGLLALGLARIRGDVLKTFRTEYSGLGTVLVFTAAALLIGTGALTFFLPLLTDTAETLYVGLKAAARPLMPVLIALLRFMFAPRSRTTDEPGGSGLPPPAPSPSAFEPSGWGDVLGTILAWAAVVTFFLATLLVAAFLLHCAWVWLMSEPDRTGPALESDFDPLRTLGRLIKRLVGLARRLAKGPSDPLAVYQGLLRWGRRGGLPRRPSETPREYGRRLAAAFPGLASEIADIVDALETFVYAEQALETGRLARVLKSRRRLARPDLWPRRLKVRLIGLGAPTDVLPILE